MKTFEEIVEMDKQSTLAKNELIASLYETLDMYKSRYNEVKAENGINPELDSIVDDLLSNCEDIIRTLNDKTIYYMPNCTEWRDPATFIKRIRDIFLSIKLILDACKNNN